MSEVEESAVALIASLAEFIPRHSFAIEVRFWGPKLAFRRVVLVTDPKAFGEEGGAEVPEDERSERAMRGEDVQAIEGETARDVLLDRKDQMGMCAFPFELIDINELRARYTLTASEDRPIAVELAASTFIGSLTTSRDLVLAYHNLIEFPQGDHLHYGGRNGQESVVISLTRAAPAGKRRSRRKARDKDIVTW